MSRKKTHDEFVAELKVKNPNVEVVGEYENNKVKIQCICKEHGVEFDMLPNNLLRGQGCYKCRKQKQSVKFRKTHAVFISEMSHINPNVAILSEYLNNKVKVECVCSVCGHHWSSCPGNLLKGYGCPICANKRRAKQKRKPFNKFCDELRQINPNVSVIGEYKNSATRVKCRCLIDGYEWNAYPKMLLNGAQCPECSNRKYRDEDEFIKDLACANSNVRVIGQYIDTKHKILVECAIDGHKWMACPANLLKGIGCPVCSKSKGEKSCENFFIKHQVNIIPQYSYNDLRGNYKPLAFDFAIIDSTSHVAGLVEYDGEYHYKKVHKNHNLEQQQRYDKLKNEYCEAHGIPLLRIPYTQFNDIDTHLSWFCSEIGVLN